MCRLSIYANIPVLIAKRGYINNYCLYNITVTGLTRRGSFLEGKE